MRTSDVPIAEYNTSDPFDFFSETVQFVLAFGIMQRKIWWKASSVVKIISMPLDNRNNR